MQYLKTLENVNTIQITRLILFIQHKQYLNYKLFLFFYYVFINLN